jgi:hypothetical protein
MDNSRIFDDAKDTNESKDSKIIFEYRNYLTSEQMNKKTNLLLYVIEKGVNPYVYYLMNKINDIITLPSLYLKNKYQVDKFMMAFFPHSPIVKQLAAVKGYDESLKCTNSFKELGITKRMIAEKLYQARLLPDNFYTVA